RPRMVAQYFTRSATVPQEGSGVTSCTAPLSVKDIFVPVSPSGTGNTFSAFTASACCDNQREAATSAANNCVPSQPFANWSVVDAECRSFDIIPTQIPRTPQRTARIRYYFTTAS